MEKVMWAGTLTAKNILYSDAVNYRKKENEKSFWPFLKHWFGAIVMSLCAKWVFVITGQY